MSRHLARLPLRLGVSADPPPTGWPTGREVTPYSLPSHAGEHVTECFLRVVPASQNRYRPEHHHDATGIHERGVSPAVYDWHDWPHCQPEWQCVRAAGASVTVLDSGRPAHDSKEEQLEGGRLCSCASHGGGLGPLVWERSLKFEPCLQSSSNDIHSVCATFYWHAFIAWVTDTACTEGH